MTDIKLLDHDNLVVAVATQIELGDTCHQTKTNDTMVRVIIKKIDFVCG
jgi:hypothetical protein